MSNGLLSERKRLCRLCLTNQGEMFPIFGGEIPDLAEKIYDCTTVEVYNIDGLPALICQQCQANIVICNSFLRSCQKVDRLFGPKFRQHGLPKVPAKVVTNGAVVPAKSPVLDRLKNDDKLRRQSVNEDRKDDIKRVIKKRLSEESHVANTSMELLAVKIEQSIKNELDQQVEVDGRQKCSKCGLLVHNLRQHKQLHATVGKHVCGICNKTFPKRFLLKYHANSHTGEKPYECTECGQRFSSPTNLYRHKQIHSGSGTYHRSEEDQRFHCNVCHCVFKHRKLIQKHMRANHRERKFPCDTCGKAYFTREYLNKHLRLVHRSSDK
uniref:Zinc finger protein 333 n=3 Tax=Culex pipiens TaxID=7175 RepID=A0A8D8PEW0_CULPI